MEYVGETLVFIGVVGEVFAEWREPERKRLAKASSVVLVIGLALSLASLIATNEYFDGTIATLNLQAKQAGERAAQDELDTAQARKEADSFQSQIADATARTKEAEATAENERLARIRLEARMADRRLSMEQRSAIRTQLSEFQHKGVQINLINSDGEIEAFSQDLSDALSKIDGWVVAIDSLTMPEGSSGVHIVIEPNATDADKRFADGLVSAIRSAGITVTGPRPPRPFIGPALEAGTTLTPKPKVTIVIGKKP